MSKLKSLLKVVVKPRGNAQVLRQIPRNGVLLDVGCGNNSPMKFKLARPDIYYIGLDVSDHNQAVSPETIADRYLVTSPEDFAKEIQKLEGSVDAVISSHNIEHCNHPDEVLVAMLRSLKQGGHLYLTFPCEESVSFPSRRSTLNFYDDKTHFKVPDYHGICQAIRNHGLKIDFTAKRYRPPLLFLAGLLTEPINALRGVVNPATWALYGFESIIWASLPASSNLHIALPSEHVLERK